MNTKKPVWIRPELVTLGRVEELTLQKTVTKTFGAGDDVILIPNGPGLENVS